MTTHDDFGEPAAKKRATHYNVKALFVMAFGDGSALHIAAVYNASNIEVLLSRGVEVDVRDRNGCTPLMYAAECGTMDCIKKLLRAGANVDAPNDFGETPAMYAARHDPCILEYFIKAGADINAVSMRCTTALHHALEARQPKSVAVLLEAGADPNIPYHSYQQAPSVLRFALEYNVGGGAIQARLCAGAELRRHESVPCLEPAVDVYLRDTYRHCEASKLRRFCDGTHPRLGLGSPVGLLAGFPQIAEFIVRHALPRVAATGADDVQLY
jgi:hypothetical protein